MPVQQGPISTRTNAASTRTATKAPAKPKVPEAPKATGPASSFVAVEASNPPVGVVAAPPKKAAKRRFVFYHGASAAFRWLLPEALRSATTSGYVEFRPDGFSRDGTRIDRGKYVTDNAEIAKALRDAIAEKRLRGAWEDDSHLRLRCEYCDFTAGNNEQGRREMQAHVQVEHDRI